MAPTGQRDLCDGHTLPTRGKGYLIAMDVTRTVHVTRGGDAMSDLSLPGVPLDLVRRFYAAAPGNEIEGGKFASPESSAILVANAFGLFLGDNAARLPPLPVGEVDDWPPLSVRLEAQLRLPWRSRLRQRLDVLIETSARLIGIESMRYEPYRSKGQGEFSQAYDRPVWGNAMDRYTSVRKGLTNGTIVFARLDAAQLVKHAYGLRTAVHRKGANLCKRPMLVYLFAEPTDWPDGRPIPVEDLVWHRVELQKFADMVAGDEVAFASSSYLRLLGSWQASPDRAIRDHAAAVQHRFVH